MEASMNSYFTNCTLEVLNSLLIYMLQQ